MLRLLFGIYHIFIQIRNFFFNHGLFREVSLSVPVVSVGNVSFGGTGKTPMVIWLAKQIQKEGFPVVILSRGYKRRSFFPKIVSDYAKVLSSLRAAGDEPYLVAKKLPGVPVIVARNRVRGARKAIKRFNPRVILLDDGFQHRKLARKFDIVLLDKPQALKSNVRLREPVKNLRRADTVVFTKYDQYEKAQDIVQDFVQAFACPVFHAKYEPVAIRNDVQMHEAEKLKGKTVFLVAGIGNPKYFRHIVKDIGAHVTREFLYQDHAKYSRWRIRRILKKFDSCSADYLITTEKDWHKLKKWIPDNCPFYYLDIEMDIHRPGLLKNLVFEAAYLSQEESSVEIIDLTPEIKNKSE
ncbi:tetraacyldisaccharide 4'-kinase [candidate division KSB1 bacterium]